MKLKYNRDTELEIVGIGIFEPGQTMSIENDDQAYKYIKTGYFDLIKEKEIKKRKIYDKTISKGSDLK